VFLYPEKSATVALAADLQVHHPQDSEDNVPPPGIDVSKLDEFERKIFFRIVQREPSVCGKGHSLLFSAKNDPTCRSSFYAVRYVIRLVNSGYTDSEISEKLEKRFRLPRLTGFNLAGTPFKGNPGARVTLIEFVDYECPHCLHAQTLLRHAMDTYPADVRLFFKHFPLSSNSNSRQAAEASIAAHKQEKFWPYNERVWAVSGHLTPSSLEKIAKEVGLDLPRWRLDKESEDVKKHVQNDKNEGIQLGINATPTILINGRKYTDALELTSLRDWIDEELKR
jgi:predicted DsbA family dithiol-disulfide isomerase